MAAEVKAAVSALDGPPPADKYNSSTVYDLVSVKSLLLKQKSPDPNVKTSPYVDEAKRLGQLL